jgi:hypothetical protein
MIRIISKHNNRITLSFQKNVEGNFHIELIVRLYDVIDRIFCRGQRQLLIHISIRIDVALSSTHD